MGGYSRGHTWGLTRDMTGIGDREWLYHAKFDVSEKERAFKNAELVFDGLDTLCDVYLVST